MGNKNGNGKKLGQGMNKEHIKVDHFAKPFRGNKNKTGKKLGLNSTEGFRADKDLEQKVHNMVLPETQLVPTNVDTQVHTSIPLSSKTC